jgi:hypothetical protein
MSQEPKKSPLNTTEEILLFSTLKNTLTLPAGKRLLFSTSYFQLEP